MGPQNNVIKPFLTYETLEKTNNNNIVHDRLCKETESLKKI